MNIDKIIIKNFKNYIDEHTFDLNKKLTIILGKNGFGKSSFFDAIEWCMTGKLNRFNKKEFNSKDVLNFYKYGIDKECKVQIIFNGHTLERRFKYRDEKLGNVQLKLTKSDGTIIRGQSNIDNFLRNNYFRTKKENSETFGDLIKHSHLLSQDQVTDFVTKDNPKERFNSLAEIIGLKNVLYTFENYNQIKKATQKRIENLKEKKLIFNNQIKERRNDLISIDQKNVYLSLKALNVKERFRNSFLELEKLRKNEEEKLFHNKRFIQIYEKYKEIGYENIDEIENKLKEIKTNIETTDNDIKEKAQLKHKIKSLSNSIHNQSDKFQELNNTNNQIKSIKSQIEANKYGGLKIDEITISLNNMNEEIEKLNFSKSYQRSLNEMNQFIKNYSLIQKRLTDKTKYISRKMERIDILLKNIDQKIIEQDNGITAKLLDHLKGILDFINSDKDSTGKCPVCSTELGSTLPLRINKNINQYRNIVEQDAKYAEKYLSMKKRMSQKRDQAISISKDLANQIENNKNKQKDNKIQIEYIVNNGMFSPEYMNNLSYEELDVLQQEKRDEISLLNKILSLKLELRKLNTDLEVLKKIVGTSHNNEDFEVRMRRLEKAENRIENYLFTKNRLKKSLEEDYNKLHSEFSELSTQQTSRTLNEQIEHLNKINLNTENNIEKISELLNMNQTLKLNKKIGQDIRKYYIEKTKLNQQIEELSSLSMSITSFMNSMQNVIGSETATFLNAQNSLIQKYYRYLNPMSNSRGVTFEAENGELNICIPIKGERNHNILFKAKHTLSSGQLNVLAISIFLAVNESQKVSNLDFIGIDDPIQNMDDVNRFSICDVLSNIDKQVIISTHDMEFVKLLIKKNQHKLEQMQVYILESPLLEADKVKKITF
ncbi:AAA family ATPase [Priestia megaterium]|uniref:AAA family ATPase n=1 Tax=Priestia megaterium TaxID=1404 RepID=UPI001C2272B1|nr:SMC family ATPase [Priestia megaterium]MBU8852752.1 SMC family ATPase [Bacillus sp. FJAT-26377]MCU7738868.1 SMC family ATPase [Priestia megaterium]